MKKTTLIVLSLVMVFGLCITASANSFSDVPTNHWAYDAINKLVATGIISGYPDGTYKGQKNLNRYEIAVIVSRVLDQISQEHENMETEINFTKNDLSSAQAQDVTAIVKSLIEKNMSKEEKENIPEGLTEKQAEEASNLIEALTFEYKDELKVLGVNLDILKTDVKDLKIKVADLNNDLNKEKEKKFTGTISGEIDYYDEDDDDTGCPYAYLYLEGTYCPSESVNWYYDLEQDYEIGNIDDEKKVTSYINEVYINFKDVLIDGLNIKYGDLNIESNGEYLYDAEPDDLHLLIHYDVNDTTSMELGADSDCFFEATKENRMAEFKFNKSFDKINLGFDYAKWEDVNNCHVKDLALAGEDVSGYSLVVDSPITDKLDMEFAYYTIDHSKQSNTNSAWQIGGSYQVMPKISLWGTYGVAENGNYYEHDNGVADCGFVRNLAKLDPNSRKDIDYYELGTTLDVFDGNLYIYMDKWTEDVTKKDMKETYYEISFDKSIRENTYVFIGYYKNESDFKNREYDAVEVDIYQTLYEF